MNKTVLVVSIAALAPVLALACGNTAPGVSGPADASSPVDSSMTVPETSTTDASGADTSVAPGEDSAADAVAPVNCAEADSGSCRMCCAAAYPSGFAAATKLELACACAADLCGPIDAGANGDAGPGDDGGADGGDASLLGSGACASTCATSAIPAGGSTCASCLKETLGSLQAYGPCASGLAGQCVTDPTCEPFLSCITSCP